MNYIIKTYLIKIKKILKIRTRIRTKIKLFKLRKTILKEYKNNNDESLKPTLKTIKKHLFLSFIPIEYQYGFKPKNKIKVFKDKYNGLLYIIENNKRLYFSRHYDTKISVKNYYRWIFIEQYQNSPHCYTDKTFKVNKGDVLYDIGAAEGIFAFQNIELSKHVYLFECDDHWIEALKCTFKDYEHKVTIVPKFVGDKTDTNSITLDEFSEGIKKSNDTAFIKMDIEGNEVFAIKNC
ncbi:MAG: FkbM family methyltransferase [Bacilli bacterium]|nr:FkbM family methyltransferase [Bacilli bacterium]MDD4808930.1 FkbM family methyltransferase [Bacilli bacterium]